MKLKHPVHWEESKAFFSGRRTVKDHNGQEKQSKTQKLIFV